MTKAAFLSLDCPVHEGGSQKEALTLKKNGPRQVFILLSGSALEQVNLGDAVLKLKKRGQPFSFVFEKNGSDPTALLQAQKKYRAKDCIEGEPFHRLEELVLEAQAVYLPSMSLKVASKLALGLVDEFPVAFLWNCLLKKVPVYASSEALLNTCKEAPQPMKNQVEQHLETLRAYGLTFVSELPEVEGPMGSSKADKGCIRLTDCLSKQVITERHVSGLEKGSRLLVSKGIRVTPLARDVAKSRRIEIVLE